MVFGLELTSVANDPKNPLPIHPKVTPAMGITGALLLITGLVYAVIGIKNKWYVSAHLHPRCKLTVERIYVFGSAAYLTALAVTVLIVYLMNPPVSDSIQGAFFVAAFITGVIFGVLSLVFADITEGFGCLLGGFCLSMWMLSLKNDGLITSTTGRAIFIGCMSAGGYSLSFSHYTRNYSLIASISFSGATATMLGIDCLSRAGWKEFWLYLWALNEDIFPLNTNTYPVTKNIKAELAGVVIIAAFGVVSQLRVWNLVKDRRAKTAAQELEQQQEKDREEEARGRNVEDNFQKERAQWEAAYGNKNHVPDSTIGSSIGSAKGSSSIKEREVYGVDSMEMAHLNKAGVAADGTTITVSILRDDDIRQVDAQGNPITHRNGTPGLPNDNNKLQLGQTERGLPVKPQRASLRTAAPPVVPLPFTVPNEDTRSEDGDNNSIAAMPHSPSVYGRMSKRVSDMSTRQRSSLKRGSRVFSDSSEALERILQVDDDRASSVAATMDNDHDDVSVRQLSPAESPIGTEREDPFADVKKRADTAPTQSAATANVNKDSQEAIETEDSRPIRPAFRQSLTSSTDPRPDEFTNKRESLPRVDTVVSSSRNSIERAPKSSASNAPSEGLPAERTESHVGSLMESAPPAKLSKVALSYRTNEWAKHLEAAEKPDLDELPSPVSPGVMLEDDAQEKSVPVSDELAAPLMVSQRNSRRVSSGSKMNRASGFGLDRSTSSSSQALQIDQRSTAPSPAMPSPGALSHSPSTDQLDGLAPLPSTTLLGQRETLMRKRTSSQSFSPNTSASNLLEQADAEELSLAQRRQLLQHHQSTSPVGLQHQTSTTSLRKPPPSTAQKWQNKPWATKGAPAGFDSHQPKRTSNSQSDQRREELLAGWRNNIQEVATPQTQAYMVEQQRVALLNERRVKEVEKQQREAKLVQRASQLDSMMRSGQMLGAHREAMRKMQADATRRAS